MNGRLLLLVLGNYHTKAFKSFRFKDITYETGVGLRGGGGGGGQKWKRSWVKALLNKTLTILPAMSEM